MTTTGVYSLIFYFVLILFLFYFSDACIIFKWGKSRDGWFSASDLLTQVENVIDIFEGITKGLAQGLFLFNNALSYQKHANNAISAL